MRSPLLLAAVLVLAGCSASPPPSTAELTPSPPSSSVPAPPSSSPAPEGLAAPGAPQLVVDGLLRPWEVVPLGDDVLVSESDSGRILRVSPGGETDVLATVPVDPDGEGGLLGLTFDPERMFLYAYRTTPSENEVLRLPWDGSMLGEPEVIFDALQSGRIHNGGRIVFGPDGMLYVGTGDAGVEGLSQDPASPNGKVLRLMPDGSVPSDNPLPGNPLFSLGHRNVQGLAFDSAGRLWASEFGQDRVDEVNLLVPGGNYGWPLVEGAGGREGFIDPLVEWEPAEASPSGAAIVDDVLYVAALRGERLWQVELLGEAVGELRPLLTGELGRLRTAVPAGGGLFLLTSNASPGGEPVDGLYFLPLQ